MSTATRAPADVRLRVRRVVGAAALEPPGLPPAALLVVRSLADPLPRRLAPRPGDVRAPAAWEAAVRGALAEQWRGAARPARDAVVPASAGAVFFADTAEMIAAFARDAAAGDVGRWWWRALLPGLPGGPVEALSALWTREARYVPTAVEALAGSGDAARVLGAFSAPQVARILAALAWAWDAPGLAAAPPAGARTDAGAAMDEQRQASSARATRSPAGGEDSADRRDSADGGDADRPRASAGAASSRPMAPPWRGFLPPGAVPRGLGTEAAALLGLSLMLHRAPHVARGRGFVARFVRWRAESASPAPPSPAPPRDAAPRPTDRPSPADARHPSPDARRRASTQSRPAASADGTGRIASPEARSRADGDAAARGAPPADRDASTETAWPGRSPAQAGGGTADGASSIATRDGVKDGDALGGLDGDGGGWSVAVHHPPPEQARAASGACGVFFLVNVLRSLGFGRALDEHFAVTPVVGGWGWTELVARALLGPRAGGLADDPVWRLLAELDGRAPGEMPGGGFVPPATEALPRAWRELFRGTPPAPDASPLLGMRAAPGLQRFLDVVVPVVRARIRGALAAAGADPDETLETALFRRVGTVEATRTHVDVRMGLDQATLPVRLAGLDASPGWVPELARVVTFHFEDGP